jgi:hypothetical protein
MSAHAKAITFLALADLGADGVVHVIERRT